MKARRAKFPSDTVIAAGGIVVSAERPLRVAVVQRRKDDGWVLPKGKLKPRETAIAGARREASEETGHRVVVHDYLGVLSYESGTRPKIVQFWRMVATGERQREPMSDIKAVKWLPLQDAVARLSHPIERAFLAHVGERVLKPGVERISSASRSKLAKKRSPARHAITPSYDETRHQDVHSLPKPQASPGFIRRWLRRLQDQDRALS